MVVRGIGARFISCLFRFQETCFAVLIRNHALFFFAKQETAVLCCKVMGKIPLRLEHNDKKVQKVPDKIEFFCNGKRGCAFREGFAPFYQNDGCYLFCINVVPIKEFPARRGPGRGKGEAQELSRSDIKFTENSQRLQRASEITIREGIFFSMVLALSVPIPFQASFAAKASTLDTFSSVSASQYRRSTGSVPDGRMRSQPPSKWYL